MVYHLKKSIYTIIFLPLLIIGCAESGPSIDFIIPQSDKMVLVEEFTGVNCKPCPLANAKLEVLDSIYQGNLIIVSIHAGMFSIPIQASIMDLRNPESESIYKMLKVSTNPQAAIDRRLFQSENKIPLDKAKWPGRISEQMQIAPPVSIDISVEPLSAARNLIVHVIVQFNADVLQPAYISIMITEDSVVDAQDTPQGIDTFYVHNHVLRGMITQFDGIPLEIQQQSGKGFERTYDAYKIPVEWREKHLNVVAFIHLLGEDLTVLQATETKLDK